VKPPQKLLELFQSCGGAELPIEQLLPPSVSATANGVHVFAAIKKSLRLAKTFKVSFVLMYRISFTSSPGPY
jgi:hypothetical protein